MTKGAESLNFDILGPVTQYPPKFNKPEEFDKEFKVLFAQYLASSEEAFNEIHTILSPRILSYLRKRLRKDEDVAEVYQGFFVKLHKSRELFNFHNPILPWIYSVLRSELLDFVKISGRHKKRVDAFFNEQMSHLDLVPSLHGVGENNSLDGLLNSMNLKADAIDLLKMRFEEELTTKEIASRLNSKEAAVRKRLSRLIESMKSQFSGKGGSQNEK